jgi:hypothetical protein
MKKVLRGVPVPDQNCGHPCLRSSWGGHNAVYLPTALRRDVKVAIIERHWAPEKYASLCVTAKMGQ